MANESQLVIRVPASLKELLSVEAARIGLAPSALARSVLTVWAKQQEESDIADC